MFAINDVISYSVHGVCRISEIAEKNFTGTPKTYYVLRPVGDEAGTLYVPVDSEELVPKMHRVLSSQEIQEMIRSMPEKEALWIENDNERKDVYKEIIAKGDRMELIRLIKAIYLHQKEQKAKGKKLYEMDARFMKTAEKMLYEEFAHTLHIAPDQVLPFILKQLDSKDSAPS